MRETDRIIDGCAQEMIECLREIIRIPSVKEQPAPGAPFGRNINKALEYTLSLCRRLGFETANVDGYAGYAQFPGQKEEQLGILCHLDVVPAGEGWLHPPYEGVYENGVIYGRGAVDDKGPAISAIYALAALKRAGAAFRRTPRIIFGCDEESGWECMDYYASKIGMPEMGFSPDADYPIINTEKGIYHAQLKKKISRGENYSISIHGGTRANVVPDCAQAYIKGNTAPLIEKLNDYDCSENNLSYIVKEGALEITAKGISAHASQPAQGQNAFFSLLELLDKLSLGGEEGHIIQMLNCAFINKTDGSGIPGLKIEDEFGALTINLGLLDAGDYYGGQPDEISLTVDVRFPVSYNYQYVENQIARFFHGWSLIRGHVQLPHHTPEEHELIQALKRVYKEYFGREGKCLAIGGGTYARALKTGVAFGITPEGEISPAHNKEESITAEQLILNAKVFAAAIEELACK